MILAKLNLISKMDKVPRSVFQFQAIHMEAILLAIKPLSSEQRPYNQTYGNKSTFLKVFGQSLSSVEVFQNEDGSPHLCSTSVLTEKLELVRTMSNSYYVSVKNWEDARAKDDKDDALKPCLTVESVQKLVSKVRVNAKNCDETLLRRFEGLMYDIGKEDNK